MVFLTSCGIAKKTYHTNNDKTNIAKITKEKEVTPYQDGDTGYLFRVKGKYFQKYNGNKFEKYYIEGVNIGSSKPNTFPGELGVTKQEYLQWFKKIGEMHANTIRVYTVMMPAFYDALYTYNTTHEQKLYLLQGCWYDEARLDKTQDAFTDLKNVKKDLKDLVDIIHGDAHIEKRAGHAYGDYTKDISSYVIGWILGIESDQDLVAHNDCPVLIAEFGIPASRGVTHVNPLTGFNQGAVTAEQQGEMLISMFEDIKKADCAGGLIFVWEDEWFKRTWNTVDYTNSDYRAYWNDVQTSEQHFGLMEYISAECNPIPVLDGKLDDWNKHDILLQKGDVRVYAKCDSTYLYLAVENPSADFTKVGNNLYFDINPQEGCGNYGEHKLPVKADFILHMEGKNNTRMLADTASDPYIRATEEWMDLDLKQDQNDSFHRIYLITDRSLTYPQTGKKAPVQKEETGHLRYGKVDVENEVGDVLTDFYYKDSVFEARIPWGLLGFSAPSVKEINNIKDNTTLTVEGIKIGYLSGNEDLGDKMFSWDNWDQASYKPHLRKSYYMLQKYLDKN